MTLPTMKGTVMTFMLLAALFTFSCKGKEEDKSIDATSTENTGRDVTGDTSTATSPITTTTDSMTVNEDQLRDAIKDYPNVTATVNNGEVTLTGSIERDQLPKLMQRVQALNPKKVNNNLSIK
ncbi:BON domain-containing protein [Niastella populi]|nr:BON domain-containing protein [Niastella populi]